MHKSTFKSNRNSFVTSSQERVISGSNNLTDFDRRMPGGAERIIEGFQPESIWIAVANSVQENDLHVYEPSIRMLKLCGFDDAASGVGKIDWSLGRPGSPAWTRVVRHGLVPAGHSASHSTSPPTHPVPGYSRRRAANAPAAALPRAPRRARCVRSPAKARASHRHRRG